MFMFILQFLFISRVPSVFFSCWWWLVDGC